MKNLLYLILFLFATAAGYGQTYHPFPKDSAVWTVVAWHYIPFPLPPDYQYYEYDNWHFEVNGNDTLIDSVRYSIVYRTRGVDFNAKRRYIATLIREDTNHRIYCYENGKEILIYDWGLSVGDTFENDYSQIGLSPLIVTNIDSVYLNDNSIRKRITLREVFHSSEDTSWIEGIGDSLSPLYYLHSQAIADVGNNLTCFWQKGEYLIGGTDCTNYTSIEENSDDPELSIGPNPFSGRFIVNHSSQIPIRLFVYNSFSQEVLNKTVDPGGDQIDLSDQPAGVYLVVVRQEKQLAARKIVKLDGRGGK